MASKGKKAKQREQARHEQELKKLAKHIEEHYDEPLYLTADNECITIYFDSAELPALQLWEQWVTSQLNALSIDCPRPGYIFVEEHSTLGARAMLCIEYRTQDGTPLSDRVQRLLRSQLRTRLRGACTAQYQYGHGFGERNGLSIMLTVTEGRATAEPQDVFDVEDHWQQGSKPPAIGFKVHLSSEPGIEAERLAYELGLLLLHDPQQVHHNA